MLAFENRLVNNTIMTSGEYPTIEQNNSFNEAVRLISKLVASHRVASDEGDAIYEFPGWDGVIRRLDLEPEVAGQAALGNSVRAQIIGDYESGIAIIMRSRNLFDARRYGFYLQPQQQSLEENRTFQVWQAPAQKPKRGVLYWGIELLDREQAQPCSPVISESLIKSLQLATR